MKMTSQHGKIRQITPLCPKVNYILKNAYGKYPNAPCMCQTGKYFTRVIQTKGPCPRISHHYLRNPSGYVHDMLHKSTHEFET